MAFGTHSSRRGPFRVLLTGRRLLQHDRLERRRLAGSVSIAALPAAFFSLAAALFLRLRPLSSSLGDVAMGHALRYVCGPLLAMALYIVIKRPSPRFVLGGTTSWAHLGLAAASGVTVGLALTGVSLLLSVVAPGLSFRVVPKLLSETVVCFHASLLAHALAIVLGVVVTSLALGLFVYGIVAPALDIGLHRRRATLGAALSFALIGGDIETLVTFCLVGTIATIIRLLGDSLASAISFLTVFSLVAFALPGVRTPLSRLLFGLSRIDPSQLVSLALIVLLSGVALSVPCFVFLHGMWKHEHTKRVHEALQQSGDRALPTEPDRPLDGAYVLALLVWAAAFLI